MINTPFGNRHAAMGPSKVNEHERYLFDLQGFLVVENLLTGEELTACNEALDRNQDLIRPRPREQSLSGTSTALQGEEGRLEITRSLLRLEKPWCEPFRGLLAHQRIVPYLTELIGPGFRLDHGPVLIGGRQGTEGHVLHGGGEPYDPAQYYFHKNGRMYNGLTVVSWQLTDVNDGDGGFCCIPGSHKSNYPCPPDIKRFEAHQQCVRQVVAPAGSVILFTEALTHGTLPWRGQGERRSILFKYSPGFLAWGGGYPAPDELLEELSPEAQVVMERPYRYQRRTLD
jgi:ectoine hydroxylase-related dioxygenase (phytanoyl-CoA dioxygenase family)